jgi:hypothetical protein
MTAVPPDDNLPGPSMKWGRWVTSAILRIQTRLDNADQLGSNNRSATNGTISSLQQGLARVGDQITSFFDTAVFDAARITTGVLSRPVTTGGAVSAGTITTTGGATIGNDLVATGTVSGANLSTQGNVSANGGTFLGTITAAAISIAQGIFPTGVRSVGARNNIVVTDYAGAWIDADGNFGISPSSRAMKKDITNWSGTAIQNLLKLQAVMFRYKTQDSSTGKKQIGLIAEDVIAAGFPEFVFYDKAGVLQGLNYDRITVALIELAKYQDARISKLESTILSLKL